MATAGDQLLQPETGRGIPQTTIDIIAKAVIVKS